MVDYIIIGVILFIVITSLNYILKRKKTGGSSCGSSCIGCPVSQGCSLEKKKEINNELFIEF